jgi:hypothetical protein
MKLRQLAAALGIASAFAAGASIAQTTVVVGPSVRTDPNPPVVVVTPHDTYVVTPVDLPPGQHYSVDSYGHRIVVDDAYDTSPPGRRSIFDSSVDHATGTVTTPGYMGPRDSTGQ